MSFISKSMKVAKNFNVLEISFFKIYLVTVALILSIWFPLILSADIFVYLTVFIISTILIFSIMFKKQGNFYKALFKKGFGIHIFKKMSILDISIFKVTMFSFGLLIAKLFPVVLTAHIAWYIAIAALFIGYYFNSLVNIK